MAKYRIVRDGYAGYEVQVRRWWWPFWIMLDVNTNASEAGAIRWLSDRLRRKKSGPCIRELGTERDVLDLTEAGDA